MLKEKFAVGSIAFLLSAFSFSLLGSTANALTPAVTGTSMAEPNIQLAYVKKKVIIVEKHDHNRWRKEHRHRVWVYEPRYGHRFHYRRPGYDYYYGGWWYPRRYWEEPEPYFQQPGINLCIGC